MICFVCGVECDGAFMGSGPNPAHAACFYNHKLRETIESWKKEEAAWIEERRVYVKALTLLQKVICGDPINKQLGNQYALCAVVTAALSGKHCSHPALTE